MIFKSGTLLHWFKNDRTFFRFSIPMKFIDFQPFNYFFRYFWTQMSFFYLFHVSNMTTFSVEAFKLFCFILSTAYQCKLTFWQIGKLLKCSTNTSSLIRKKRLIGFWQVTVASLLFGYPYLRTTMSKKYNDKSNIRWLACIWVISYFP